jgi:hypothetical protein
MTTEDQQNALAEYAALQQKQLLQHAIWRNLGAAVCA